jgi:hypothetical protein
MSQPETLDLSQERSLSFDTKDGGMTGTVTCFRFGKKPKVGDYLILANGVATTRYQVIGMDYCMNVDPPTMFIAGVKFAPRSA